MRIGGKLDAFTVKMQPGPAKKRWIFALFAALGCQNRSESGTN